MRKKVYRVTGYARDVLAELEAAVEITDANRAMVLDYCECMGRVRTLELRLREEGLTLKGCKGQRIKNPVLQILRDTRTSAQNYARLLKLGQAQPKEKVQAPEVLDGSWGESELVN